MTAEIHLVPYRGYGGPSRFYLQGRVLRGRALPQAQAGASLWHNFRQTWQRIESDEVQGVCVRAGFAGERWETTSDSEGYFEFELALSTPAPPGEIWRTVELYWQVAGAEEEGPVPAEVLTPPATAEYGVISDIDDTVLQTNANNPLLTAWRMVFQNAVTRRTFPGVPAFYAALQGGSGGRAQNPIFYVSSSPWNLYDLICQFLQYHRIPSGPVFLRDYDANFVVQARSHEHKLGPIRRILDMYRALPFVLLGDSGQQDPELYLRVIQEHPGRIRAIYIRDVSATRRDRQVDELAAAAQAAGVEMERVADIGAAAESAAALGLIPAAAVDEVRAAVKVPAA